LHLPAVGRADAQQPDGHTVEYRYDSEEQLVAVINQRGEAYRLRRDPLGRIVEETDYWGQSRQYQYNACGRLTAAIDPLCKRIGFATDALGRIVRKTLPDVRAPGQQVQEQFAYDARGQLVELRNQHRTATRRFDALGQVLEEVQDGFRVGYGYDAVGNRVLRETSAGNRIAYGYDLRDQVVEVAINDDAPIAIERDALGRTTREQLSAHVQRQFQYDGRSLLTAQSVLKDAVPLFETQYDYDRAGNLTHRRDSVQGVDEYRYDVLGRLLQHTDPKGRIERFFNDPAGDRLATRVQQVQLRKVVGGDDEQQVQWTREGSYDGVHYVFDRAGDLIRKGSPNGPEPDDLELLWDANHRLAESRKGGQVTHYGYDPLGRRVFKRNPTHTTWFYWDGDALMGEVKQAHDEPEAAPVWVGNVANLIEAKRRKEKLAKLHERTREYVYYPDTFVPLALVEKEPRTASKANTADGERAGTHSASKAVSTSPGKIANAGRPDGAAKFAASVGARQISANSFGVLGGTALGGTTGDAIPLSVRAVEENAVEGLEFSEATQVPVTSKRQADALLKQSSSPMRMGMQLSSSSIDRRDTHLAETTKSMFSPASSQSTGLDESEGTNSHLPNQEDILESRSVVYHYHVDLNGCPTRVTSAKGEILWAVSYAAWGGVLIQHINLIDTCLRYQGQIFDEETGLNYNRYRYYDARLGQYIGADPIGLLGGLNLYQYAYNSLQWADPLGWISTPWGNAGQGFGDWFNAASEQDIVDAMADPKTRDQVQSALRGSGGRHEWFPVSMAAKAKSLGFSYEELMKLSSPVDDVWFENVADPRRPGAILSGPHSTGKPLPAGQSSRASSHAHIDLSNRLGRANTKLGAVRIIKKFMRQHVRNGGSMARKLKCR
ncbi:RHS repeat-associated core domain-containing protein, partial [Xanthomonas fragariae]|uniref:RHS repeat-associated core domain-containing protein n=1 Tax=Xanthomonas fragariae TaxID=48664 RepID=UPI001901E490